MRTGTFGAAAGLAIDLTLLAVALVGLTACRDPSAGIDRYGHAAKGEEMMTPNPDDMATRIARKLGVPAATFRVLKETPAMDAAPNLAAWGRPLAFQDLTGFGEAPPVETRGYLATDDKHVYVAIRCDGPAAKAIASAPVPQDGNVWAGDCAEFMLLPGYDPAQPYYHFAVNPAGSLYDARGKDKAWESGARVFTTVDAAGWLAVVRVPLSALGVKEGQVPAIWRVNLYRSRPAHAGAAALDLAWSPTWSEQSHVPARFGVVSVDGGKSPEAAALEAWLKTMPFRTPELTMPPSDAEHGVVCRRRLGPAASAPGGESPRAAPVGQVEMITDSRKLFDTYLADPGTLPFSFVYDGKAYTGFPAETFKRLEHRRSVQGKKESHCLVLKSNDLQVTVDAAFHAGYGAYEWTVWFENTGKRNSGVIQDMRAADMVFAGSRPVLKGILGDHRNQYRPYARPLDEAPVQFRSDKGRPTHVWFPYFNLEHGDGGTLIALGWGGTWEAQFSTDGKGHTYFAASGTNDLRTYLKPGERIRSPLMAFLPYATRDEDHATNLWRRWFLDCNLPRLNAQGDPVKPFSTTWLAGDTGIPNSDGSISERHFTWKPSLEKMFAEGIRFDYRWFDAGWYCAPDGTTVEKDWWGTVGTWEIDAVKWPGNSFRESVDFAHAHGMRTLVWFEPERVTHVDDLVKNWGYKREWAIVCGNVIANNIGDDECFEWTLGRILAFLKRHDVDMYREDNNSNPRDAWDALAAREGENRKGIVENKSVTAHYRLWDRIIEFCARNGKDTFVDSCASGGGRNDLESLRRGIPLMRSDADRTTTALRLSMGTAFNRWVPFQGANTVEQSEQLAVDARRDVYTFRASYTPILNLSAQWVQNPKTDFDLIRFGLREWETVKDYLLKDFYLLTPWNGPADRTHWTSYVYFDPESDSGVLFAFRMEEAKESSRSHRLTMLNPQHVYELCDADKSVLGTFKGSDLAAGYTVTHPAPRSAALIYIRPAHASGQRKEQDVRSDRYPATVPAPKYLDAEQGVVCRLPGERFGYFGWPTVARLDDGTLMVASSGLRAEHVCPFGKTVLNISKDNGRTWSPPRVIQDSPIDDRDAGIVGLGKGKLLVSWFRSDTRVYAKEGWIPEAERATWEKVFATWTDTRVNELLGSWTMLSEDGGATWGSPARAPVSAPHGPILLKDGRLLYLGRPMGPGVDPAKQTAEAWQSADGGRTWQLLGKVPPAKGAGVVNNEEPHVLELPDGRLIGMLRFEANHKDDPALAAGHVHFRMYQTDSTDGGRTWRAPRSLGFHGSPPHLLRHSSGVIVLTYGYRQRPWGQRVAFTRDNGATWDHDWILRDDGRDGDLGYPSTVELADGSLFTVCYQKAAKGEKTSLLWSRWRLPAALAKK